MNSCAPLLINHCGVHPCVSLPTDMNQQHERCLKSHATGTLISSTFCHRSLRRMIHVWEFARTYNLDILGSILILWLLQYTTYKFLCEVQIFTKSQAFCIQIMGRALRPFECHATSEIDIETPNDVGNRRRSLQLNYFFFFTSVALVRIENVLTTVLDSTHRSIQLHAMMRVRIHLMALTRSDTYRCFYYFMFMKNTVFPERPKCTSMAFSGVLYFNQYSSHCTRMAILCFQDLICPV